MQIYRSTMWSIGTNAISSGVSQFPKFPHDLTHSSYRKLNAKLLPSIEMIHINNATFRAVVGLNNSGVTLLQHQCYMEGLQTLKDALMLMKILFQSDDASSMSSLQQHDEVNAALQRAKHRTNRMQEDKIVCQMTNIAVVTDLDNPFKVYNALERKPGTLCCVKIDPMGWGSCCPDSEQYHVESSIIMYNYGVAHLLASFLFQHSDDSFVAGLNQTSYHLFQLAHSVIDMYLLSSDAFNLPSNVLLVSMLTSTCLYRSSMPTQHDHHTAANLKCLQWILLTIISQERIFPIESLCSACA